MLIQKTPVSLYFPDFRQLQALCASHWEGEDFRPVFYDIETTGLSRSASFVYLIGAAVLEPKGWMLYQWFAERQADEPLLLEHFTRFLEGYSGAIQYNGSQFDQPYLEERLRVHHLSSPFHRLYALDLYRVLKPLKGLLKLQTMKQPSLEAFLKLPARLYADGKECIRLYRRYEKSRTEEYAREALGHNQEDVQGLGKITSLLSYLQLFDGRYSPCDPFYDGEHFLVTLRPDLALPQVFSNGSPSFYITGEKQQVKLAVKTKKGKLRQYYPNYKDYDYIPSEDTAMPKALSACLDKSLRRPAKPDTCYTWFSCNETFLNDPRQQLSYLRHTLPFFLGTLS